ncbi:MAG: NADH-quinone oxidoreductase subunit C [Bdellovibrionota bacterium]
MTELNMTLASWAQEVAAEFKTSLRESAPGEPEFTVDCQGDLQAAHALLGELQNRGYVHLADLTGYDEFPKSPRYHVLYELISLKEKKRCAVVAIVSDEKPRIQTVVDLWKGANWLERETYDMLGICFEGHPDHRRILLPPSFIGYPLRKDFVVDYRQDFEKSNLEEAFDPFGSTIVRPTIKETPGEHT